MNIQSGIIGGMLAAIGNDWIIANAESLDIRPALLVAILEYLVTHRNATRQNIMIAMGVPLSHLNRILVALHNYFESKRDTINLTPTARVLIETYLADNKDRQVLLNKQVRSREVLEKYQDQRPAADRKLDQFTATIDTTIRRALELEKAGDLFGRDIAFLGDDDLTSLAAAIVDLPRNIHVLDIDQRILNYIGAAAAQETLQIKTEHYDARQRLPQHLRQSFDVVFTDPPYTPDGIALFLTRAIELLRCNFTSRIYICYGTSERAKERELVIQKIILNFNVIIHQKVSNFNQYIGADSIGSNSSLYVLDPTPKILVPKATYKRLYTYE